MIKFNSNEIIVGYIKQLLSSFNLPLCKVANEDTNLIDNTNYIKEDYIQVYKNGEFTKLMPYTYGKAYPNYTTNLKIDSITYDSHTHNYLGNYLRFYRDYHKINLMSLYNCFSNEIPKTLYRKFYDTTFDTEDSNYKIFMIPIKLEEVYTIALDSDIPYEMFCGFYGKGYYEINDSLDFTSLTYKKINSSSFNHPYIYNNVKDINNVYTKFRSISPEGLETLYKHEDDLKLFIKLPFNNNSSISILEGNYINANSFIINEEDAYKCKYFKYIINYDASDIDKLNLVTHSQLLFINSKISYPFADKLINYLTDNVITPIDSIQDNIRRLQQKLNQRKGNNKIGTTYLTKQYGKWQENYKSLLYEIAYEEGLLANSFDILGYVDKDIEYQLGEDIDIYEGE